jgi:transcriptional regulator with XRE-family HTH domain
MDRACAYQDVTAVRRKGLSHDAASRRQVFEQAYDIAVQIIELRERRGLTQSQLAQRCGLDQGDVSRIERGSTSPTVRALQLIAAALDADVRLVGRIPERLGDRRSTERLYEIHRR